MQSAYNIGLSGEPESDIFLQYVAPGMDDQVLCTANLLSLLFLLVIRVSLLFRVEPHLPSPIVREDNPISSRDELEPFLASDPSSSSRTSC